MSEKEVNKTTHIQDALNIALQREKTAVRFYTEGAEKVSDPGVKELFKELAEEEKGHIRRIQDAIDKEILREM